MDFELNDVQQMLSETVAAFVRKDSPVERMRHMRDDAVGWDPKVWASMGELGWIAVPFPESVGGFGGSFADAALVLQQLGRALVPEPYLSSIIGGLALLHAGDSDQHARFLTPMLSGTSTVTLAWAEQGTRFDPSAPRTTATAAGDGYTLNGAKVWVLDGHHADHFVVSARVGENVGLFVVDPGSKGLSMKVAKSIDGRKAAWLALDSVHVSQDRRLAASDDVPALLGRLMDYGAAAAVAEGVGVAQTILDMTVEYLGTREQFGTKIGAFQALQHSAVDMFVEVQLLRSIAMASMVKADEQDDLERQRWISAAKVQLATGGRHVSHQSIQLHGGIGCTDEHDIGLYFKRMHALTTLFGDEEHHVSRFAQHLEDAL